MILRQGLVASGPKGASLKKHIIVCFVTLSSIGATAADGDRKPLSKVDFAFFTETIAKNEAIATELSKTSECPATLGTVPIDVHFRSLDGTRTGKPNNMQILPLNLKATGRKFSGGWVENELTFLTGTSTSLQKRKWIVRVKNDGTQNEMDVIYGDGKKVSEVEKVTQIAKKDTFRFNHGNICQALAKPATAPGNSQPIEPARK